MPLLGLLKTQGKLIMVAAPVKPLKLPVFPLLMGNNGGAMLGPKGALAPPKFLKKNMSRYINI